MRNHRLARCLIYAVHLLAVVPGCEAFHGYRPVSIEATDAETKKPIAGAVVKISYPLEASSWLPPEESKETTGTDGIAHLKAAPYGRAGVLVEVSAGGYMSTQKYLSVQDVEAIEPAGWFEDVRRRPVRLVLEIFADPAPTVELIVPAGYRGQIKAKVVVQEDGYSIPGQRWFRYEVPSSGEVAMTGPPLFRYLTPTNVRITFADHSPLSVGAKESLLGYWLLNREGDTYVFLVGTQREFDDCRSASQENGVSDKPSRGGGQRRGRKGTPSSDDSSTFGANP